MSVERQKRVAAGIDAAVREARRALRLAIVRAVGRIARDHHDDPGALSALHEVQAAIDACYSSPDGWPGDPDPDCQEAVP